MRKLKQENQGTSLHRNGEPVWGDGGFGMDGQETFQSTPLPSLYLSSFPPNLKAPPTNPQPVNTEPAPTLFRAGPDQPGSKHCPRSGLPHQTS